MWQNLEMSACERRSRQWVAALAFGVYWSEYRAYPNSASR